jgi:hypothetical protein
MLFPLPKYFSTQPWYIALADRRIQRRGETAGGGNDFIAGLQVAILELRRGQGS